MKPLPSLVSIVFLFLFCAYGDLAVAQQSSLLLDRLVEQGIITPSEADAIQWEQQQTELTRNERFFQEVGNSQFELPKALQGLEVGMLGYLDYSAGDLPEFNGQDTSFNAFRITRGYLTVQKEIIPRYKARVTMDTHQDSTGDWKVRLKYYYVETQPCDFFFLTDMRSEWGMGHMPWLDFEEHVNPYRCQGTMAVERAGVYNSADLGVSLRGNFFGSLSCAKQLIGHDHYNGRWGSWHVGVYNGSGYHAAEQNCNKVLEGRITLRPLPDHIPGLQVSYFGIHGDGNTLYAAGWPDYDVSMTMLSYENPWLVLTAQYFTTEGNAQGTWVDAAGDALDTSGYSFFGNVRLPICCEKLWLFGRFDHFDQDVGARIAPDAYYDMSMVGLAYYISDGNLIMVAFENTNYGNGANKKRSAPNPTQTGLGNDQLVQVVWQAKY